MATPTSTESPNNSYTNSCLQKICTQNQKSGNIRSFFLFHIGGAGITFLTTASDSVLELCTTIRELAAIVFIPTTNVIIAPFTNKRYTYGGLTAVENHAKETFKHLAGIILIPSFVFFASPEAAHNAFYGLTSNTETTPTPQETTPTPQVDLNEKIKAETKELKKQVENLKKQKKTLKDDNESKEKELLLKAKEISLLKEKLSQSNTDQTNKNAKLLTSDVEKSSLEKEVEKLKKQDKSQLEEISNLKGRLEQLEKSAEKLHEKDERIKLLEQNAVATNNFIQKRKEQEEKLNKELKTAKEENNLKAKETSNLQNQLKQIKIESEKQLQEKDDEIILLKQGAEDGSKIYFRDMKANEKTIEQLEKERDEACRKYEAREKLLESLETIRESSAKECNSLRKQLDDLRTKNNSTLKEIDKLRMLQIDLKKQIEVLEKKCSTKDSNGINSNTQIESLKQQLNVVYDNLEKKEKEADKKGQQIVKLKKQLEEKNKQLAELQNQEPKNSNKHNLNNAPPPKPTPPSAPKNLPVPPLPKAAGSPTPPNNGNIPPILNNTAPPQKVSFLDAIKDVRQGLKSVPIKQEVKEDTFVNGWYNNMAAIFVGRREAIEGNDDAEEWDDIEEVYENAQPETKEKIDETFNDVMGGKNGDNYEKLHQSLIAAAKENKTLSSERKNKLIPKIPEKLNRHQENLARSFLSLSTASGFQASTVDSHKGSKRTADLDLQELMKGLW